MESNIKYILDWELSYNVFSKKYINEPMTIYWEDDKKYTNTLFFSFGFITFTINEHINAAPYIRVLYILNEFRNQKIGYKIVNALLKHYKKQGYKKVSVEPTVESLLFWQKLGFKKGNNKKFIKELY
jgi:GNAT superfamily N-acetyltransferase